MLIFRLTRAQFESKRITLQALGIQGVDGDSGELKARGVTVKYSYSEPASTLTLSVVDYGSAPHFFVDHTIRGWFQN